jgi:hypothetical protein
MRPTGGAESREGKPGSIRSNLEHFEPNAAFDSQSWGLLAPRVRVQRDHVRETCQATCLELPGELRHDVEAAGLRGTVEGAGERRLDLVFAGFRGGGIAPRLPQG